MDTYKRTIGERKMITALVKNSRGETVLWLESIEGRTLVTINDENTAYTWDPERESAYEAAKQWVAATESFFNEPVEIVITDNE